MVNSDGFIEYAFTKVLSHPVLSHPHNIAIFEYRASAPGNQAIVANPAIDANT